MSSRWSPGIAALVGAALFVACKGGASAKHETLSSIDPVRAAFNADSGKVRAIFLASPT
jgi:hypothetical protein